MADKLTIIALCMALAFSFSLIIGCGDDDDGEAIEDQEIDYDVDFCKEAFTNLVLEPPDGCGFIFQDLEGNDLTLDELHNICEAGIGNECVMECYAASPSDCNEIRTCLAPCFE